MPPSEQPLPTSAAELPAHFWVFSADAGIVLLALLGGWLAGAVVTAFCRRWGLDWLATLPGEPAEPHDDRRSRSEYGRSETNPSPGARRWSPADLLGWLTIATAWCLALWVLAQRHEWSDIDRLALALPAAAWVIAAVLLAALGAARLLAAALAEVLSAPAVGRWIDRQLGVQPGDPPLSPALVRLTTGLVYALLAALALVALADQLQWTNLADAALALWHVAVRVLTALLALAIGWLGWRWALTPPEHNPALPDARSMHGVIVGGATLLAILVLTGSFGTTVTLVVVGLIAMLVWPLRRRLLDTARNLLGSSGNHSPHGAVDPEQVADAMARHHVDADHPSDSGTLPS